MATASVTVNPQASLLQLHQLFVLHVSGREISKGRKGKALGVGTGRRWIVEARRSREQGRDDVGGRRSGITM